MPISMIYHYTLPFLEQTSGSYVHAVNMLKAFSDLGYEVELVAGYAKDREQAIDRIKKANQKGKKFDFVFAWSTTSPSLLPRKNLSHPLLDYNFFRWCNRRHVPIGLFYGDVHWRFDFYRKNIALYKRIILYPMFWFDWFVYRRTADHLFLPSLKMKDSLPSPWAEEKISPLFPGCNISSKTESVPAKQGLRQLELFYVGSIVPPLYNLKTMVEGIIESENVRLTLCCRELEWNKLKDFYGPLDESKVRIVHAFGFELSKYYENSDLFGLVWQTHPYLNFAMPVKVFESMGYSVPIITIAGTEISRFISEQKIGWVVANKEEFIRLLSYLQSNPQKILEKRRQIESIRERHTWKARAQMITSTMMI